VDVATQPHGSGERDRMARHIDSVGISRTRRSVDADKSFRRPQTMPKNPILLVTGLTSSIGRALWPAVKDQWHLVYLGRQPLDLAHPDSELTFVPADFRDREKRWLDHLMPWEREPIGGLVHMAGVVYSDLTHQTTWDEWETMWRVNLEAAYALGRWASPRWIAGASVVLVGSVDMDHQPMEGPASAYGAAKAGLWGLTRQWAGEWGTRGVRVNLVVCGALSEGSGPANESVAQQIAARVALGRLGTPQEVAQVIAFLLSSASSYITGTAIRVDGGLGIRY
jgi:3-oxoacyl-[acyl-carrier protein] reductase